MTGLPPDPAGKTPRRRPLAAIWRRLLFGAGLVFLVAGVAGLFLPLVPGTVFLIVAAACFTRSSPRFETWLLDHPRLGPPVRRWRANGSIPRPAKAFAVASLAFSWIVLLLTNAPDAVKTGLLPFFLAVAAYIVTRPEGA